MCRGPGRGKTAARHNFSAARNNAHPRRRLASRATAAGATGRFGVGAGRAGGARDGCRPSRARGARRRRRSCALGQTGAGKTALAVELALALDGEVINCDYEVPRPPSPPPRRRRRSAGACAPHARRRRPARAPRPPRRTLRGTRARRRRRRGSPAGPGITARGSRDLALPVVEDVLARGKVRFSWAGATTTCARSSRELCWTTTTTTTPRSLPRRSRPSPRRGDGPSAAAAAALSNSELHERLRSIDPASAAKIHPNNARRVRRYLAICEAADAPASVAFERRAAKMARRSSDADSGVSGAVRFRSLFALRADHSELDLALGRRVDGMLERGLVEELERHFAAARQNERARRDDAPSGVAQAIGFHEWGAYLRARGLGGEGDGAPPPPPSDDDFAVAALRREAVEAMKADTRRLARRQLNRCRRLERSFGWRLTYLDSTAAHAAERVGDAAARRNAWAKDVVEPALEAARAFLAGGGGDGFGGSGRGRRRVAPRSGRSTGARRRPDAQGGGGAEGALRGSAASQTRRGDEEKTRGGARRSGAGGGGRRRGGERGRRGRMRIRGVFSYTERGGAARRGAFARDIIMCNTSSFVHRRIRGSSVGAWGGAGRVPRRWPSSERFEGSRVPIVRRRSRNRHRHRRHVSDFADAVRSSRLALRDGWSWRVGGRGPPSGTA